MNFSRANEIINIFPFVNEIGTYVRINDSYNFVVSWSRLYMFNDNVYGNQRPIVVFSMRARTAINNINANIIGEQWMCICFFGKV